MTSTAPSARTSAKPLSAARSTAQPREQIFRPSAPRPEVTADAANEAASNVNVEANVKPTGARTGVRDDALDHAADAAVGGSAAASEDSDEIRSVVEDTAGSGPAETEAPSTDSVSGTAQTAPADDSVTAATEETDADTHIDVGPDAGAAAELDHDGEPDAEATVDHELVEAEAEAEAVAVEAETEADLTAVVPPQQAAQVSASVTEPVPEPEAAPAPPALIARELTKSFGGYRAVDGIDLTVPTGSFYGIVGPNGAGKTTTLAMISGLLRPDSGTISVCGIDARRQSRAAKQLMGVLPDRLRTFDRLTGRQLLHYYGVLRGMRAQVVDARAADLARAFDLTNALGRVVSDYSAGMTKKVMLAGALIHNPRVLVLDEPFESVDPVSAAVILEVLGSYVAGGGTVILSSHGMDLVERVCSRVAVIVGGQVLSEGTVDEVRGDLTLEQRFVELSGALTEVEGLEWLQMSSD